MTEKTGKMRMGKRRNQGRGSKMHIEVFSKKYIRDTRLLSVQQSNIILGELNFIIFVLVPV